MNWAKKKVLITGGAGFIGSCIAGRLLKENADVTILDDFSVGRLENIPSGLCEVIKGDVCDIKLLSKIKDIDYVFHFGAPSSSFLFRKNPKLCITSTIYGFMNVLELSKAINVKKVVYPSSGTVYGNTPIPQFEAAIPQPHTTYAICKLACENLAKLYSDDFPSVGLRIFTGYGPQERHKGEFASVVTQFLDSIMKSRRPVVFGNGTQSRDFVYIDDVVEAAIKAAKENIQGIVNVGSGDGFAFNQLIQMINLVLNKKVKPIYVRASAKYVNKTLADTKRMKELLQINPIDLNEGLRKYLSIGQEADRRDFNG